MPISDFIPNGPPRREEDAETHRFAEEILARHKAEGMAFAIKARWIALSITGVMLIFLIGDWSVLYYEFLLLALAGVGALQYYVGRVGVSRPELFLLALDLVLMAFILTVPNPFSGETIPDAARYRYDGFLYFFIILAAGTLSYSWRTIVAIGHWTAVVWLIGAGLVWWFGFTDPALSEATMTAFAGYPLLVDLLDPNEVAFDRRIQEVVVFLIVTYTLAITVWRFNRLVLGNAELTRERENLSRYFSPNVVAELSHNDEPLKQTKMHDAAVLFVDIVGFTNFAATHEPGEVIDTLREFHSRMEKEVFRHGGTLDKYLGDGLMATFGTPLPSDQDAINALRCAQAMMRSISELNAERRAQNKPEIKGSLGLHYGPVVLGNIGANRLEFAVLGNTVNVASRMEKLTRKLAVEMAVSDQLKSLAQIQSPDEPFLLSLMQGERQQIRGLDEPIDVWTCRQETSESTARLH